MRLTVLGHKEFRSITKNNVVHEQFSIAVSEQTLVLNKVQLFTYSHLYVA